MLLTNNVLHCSSVLYNQLLKVPIISNIDILFIFVHIYDLHACRHTKYVRSALLYIFSGFVETGSWMVDWPIVASLPITAQAQSKHRQTTTTLDENLPLFFLATADSQWKQQNNTSSLTLYVFSVRVCLIFSFLLSFFVVVV